MAKRGLSNPIYVVAITIMALLFLGLYGCSGGDSEGKQKCELSSDCSSKGACFDMECNGGYCDAIKLDDCCGNGVCEDGESSCSCSRDCKTPCSGFAKYKDASGKIVTSKVMTMSCDPMDKCIGSVDPASIKSEELMNEMTTPAGKFNVYLRFPNIFDIEKDKYKLEMEMKTYDDSKAVMPLIVKEVRIMEGSSNVIGRTTTDYPFLGKDSKQLIEIPITYDLILAEETKKTLSVQIEYEYVPLKKVGTELVPQDAIRTTYKYSSSKPVTFVDVSKIG